MVVKASATKFLDVNKRRIRQSANGAFFVKKGGKRVYGNKATYRKVGKRVTNIKSTKKVPMAILNKLTLPRYNEGTLNGVRNWSRALFEKFGWMLLARAKGNVYKIRTYKRSISDLIKTIEHTIPAYQEKNRKRDLNIILKHVKILKEHSKML